MDPFNFKFDTKLIAEFVEAVNNPQPVSGLTHNFYRYPARFSPLFARVAIKAFSNANDLVLDPFMGGGTTLVEARALGRRAIGTDINALAHFISLVKTTPLSDNDISVIQTWVINIHEELNLHKHSLRPIEWIEDGYQNNISDKHTWPIRKSIELVLAQLDRLKNDRQRRFIRCVLLKTAQWLLDCRKEIPPVWDFRFEFFRNLEIMLQEAKGFASVVKKSEQWYAKGAPRFLCLNRSAMGINQDHKVASLGPPKLILTSPPYPGVHVLYHRWQVQSRRETPAPYWIANCTDSYGESYYTLGNRKEHNLPTYFKLLYLAFHSLAKMSNSDTIVVQMISFPEPSWQLPLFLNIMEKAGFSEITFPLWANSDDERIWRNVPNRKWYAKQKYSIHTSKEVVLFHQLD